MASQPEFLKLSKQPNMLEAELHYFHLDQPREGRILQNKSYQKSISYIQEGGILEIYKLYQLNNSSTK